MTRIFLVGCPRSGTTLLQTLLAAHPAIMSFPESHFFAQLSPRNGLLRRLGVTSRRSRRRFREFLGEAGLAPAEMGGIAPNLQRKALTRRFIATLDAAAAAAGRAAWVEKTPRHLHHIPTIERLVRGARFVHILRRGEDVVASLYEVTHQHPEAWGAPRDIDRCVKRWLRDMAISRTYETRANHHRVLYDVLVEEPTAVLQALCAAIGVMYDPSMLEENRRQATGLVLESESWKQAATRPVARPSERRFHEVFTRAQQEYVRRRICAMPFAGIAESVDATGVTERP